MNSIVMCSVVSICAAIVYRGDIDITDIETSLCLVQNDAYSYLYSGISKKVGIEFEQAKEIEFLNNYNVFSTKSELITKPVFQTLNEIKHQIVAAGKQGANKTHCYDAAKLNTTIVRQHAFDAMTLCEEKYNTVVKANITLQFQLLKTALVRSAYTMSLLDENGDDQNILDKVIALANQLFDVQTLVMAATFIDPSNNENALMSCFGKVSSSFIPDLQKVESDASACICTS